MCSIPSQFFVTYLKHLYFLSSLVNGTNQSTARKSGSMQCHPSFSGISKVNRLSMVAVSEADYEIFFIRTTLTTLDKNKRNQNSNHEFGP